MCSSVCLQITKSGITKSLDKFTFSINLPITFIPSIICPSIFEQIGSITVKLVPKGFS